MLVILNILQYRRLDSDMEIIALIGTYRNKAGAHLKAVHRSRNAAIHVSDFVSIKVITSRSRECPVLSGTDVGIEAQVLGELTVIL